MSIADGEPIQNTVFVGDLHIHCTEAELQALFGPFGTITAVKIMRSQETGRNLSYGFVYYLHRDAAVAAINNLDGYLLRGRSLRVKWAAYKDKTGKSGQSKSQGNSSEDTDKTPVHFSFISHQNEVVVTEEMLRYMFGKHGKVLDVSIRKLILDHKHQSGYGFVYYAATPEGTQSGLNAVKAYADYEANGIHYQCHISHRMDQQLQHLKVKSANDLSSMPSQGNAPELNNQVSSAPVHLNNVVDQLGAMVIKDSSTKVSNARKAQDAQPNKFNQHQYSRNYNAKNGAMYPQQKQQFAPNVSAGSQSSAYRSHGEDLGFASNIPAGFQTSYRTQVEEHGFAAHNISSGPQSGAFRTQVDDHGYGSHMAGHQNNSYKPQVDEGYPPHMLAGSQANSYRAQGDRRFANNFQYNNREKPQFPVNYAEPPISYGKANQQPVAVSSAHSGNTYNQVLSGSSEGEMGAFDQDFRRSQVLYSGEPYSISQQRMPANEVVIGKSSYVHHQSIIHPRDSRLSMNSHHMVQRNEIDQNLMGGNNAPKKVMYPSESDEVPMSFFSATTKSQSRLGLQYTSQPTSVIYSQHNFSHSNVQLLSPLAGARTLNLQQPLFEKSNVYLVQPVTTSVLSSPVSPIQSPLIMHHIPLQSLGPFHSVLPSPLGYHIFGNSGDLHYSPMRAQQSPLEFFGSGFVQADYASKVMKAPTSDPPHSFQDPHPVEPGTLEHPSHNVAPKNIPEQLQPANEFPESAPATAEGNADGSAESHPADGEESNYDSGAGEHSTAVGGAFSNATDAANQKVSTKLRKVASNRLKNMTTTVSQPAPFVN